MKIYGVLTIIIFLLVTATAGSVVVSQPVDSFKSHQVWFTPNIGSVDMLRLFTDLDQWATARENVDVFKFYGWQLIAFSEGGLAGVNILPNFVTVDAFSMLKLWDINIAAEGIVLSRAKSEGENVECKSRAEWIQDTFAWNKEIIDIVQSKDGVVRYLAMDEPFHKAYPYEENGKRLFSCRHDNVDEIAEDVAAFITQMQSAHPAVLVGDIEPYPVLSIEQLKEWIIALEKKGVSLPFFHLDVGMGKVAATAAHERPVDLAADLQELKSFLATRNIAFGVTFNDSTWDALAGKDENGRLLYNQDYSEKDYYTNAIEFIQEVKSTIDQPDHSIFQSWRESWTDPSTGRNFVRQLPINLPENDSSIYSHTRLINEGLNILKNK